MQAEQEPVRPSVIPHGNNRYDTGCQTLSDERGSEARSGVKAADAASPRYDGTSSITNGR